ncbi:MAG: sulfur oxidation c-type cytochrome SoxX [Gammaproteobacteria bacterium]
MKFFTAIAAMLLTLAGPVRADAEQEASDTGKQLAFSRDKGNCLACHVIADGEAPGNIGPPLSNLRNRFADKLQLRRQIWDATVFNPETSMPPFGKNKILSATEIDRIVDYLWTLD